MQFLVAFNVLWKRVKAIRFLMKDPKVPRRKKALVVLGIVYLLLPVDLIPPILFPIGFVDDLILWIWILWHLRSYLDKYWMGDVEESAGKYQGKQVIDDVEYEVKVETEEERKGQ